VTLKLEDDIDILKVYPHTENEAAISKPELEKKSEIHCRDLDLKPMTLKLNPDLDILKMYLQTENEVARSSHSKYIA